MYYEIDSSEGKCNSFLTFYKFLKFIMVVLFDLMLHFSQKTNTFYDTKNNKINTHLQYIL